MRFALFPDSRHAVLFLRDGGLWLPDADELRSVGIVPPTDGITLEDADQRPVLAAMVPELPATNDGHDDRDTHKGPHWVLGDRRRIMDRMQMDEFWTVNRAFHLAHWDSLSRYCGRCGTETRTAADETAKRCESCGATFYPQISPAVIVAIVKDGTLLLAHNRRHRSNMFSILAGFVEPGETLERTVCREVYEEAGIMVRNVEYFASQPWPYPNALMIGFTAEYASGDLGGMDDELESLAWFAPSDLPTELPGRRSIARQLIEWFVATYGRSEDLDAILSR